MQRLPRLFLALLLIPLSTALAAPGEEETQAWREGRDTKLRGGEGWLSLIGLHWLGEGKSRVGTAPTNDVVLAAGPSHVGEIDVSTGGVSFCPAHPSVTIDGEAGECTTLVSDAEGEYTRIEFGSVLFYLIDREGRLGLRVKDAQAPVLQAFEGMSYFPYATEWRITARFEPHEDGRVMEIPNVIGTVARMANPGRLVFDRDGQTYALEAVQYEGDDELFVIFSDRTNGKTTYGAGRFLYTPLPDEKQEVVVNFNQSYNPPCVFSEYATCPLPPPENRLRLAIEAGELDFEGGTH